jgi:hypothetical protein
MLMLPPIPFERLPSERHRRSPSPLVGPLPSVILLSI